MPFPSPAERLQALKLEPPTPEEQEALARLRPGDYEVGFQRLNDILDEGIQVFERSSRSSMGIAGDVMVAVFTAQGDLVNAAAGTYLHAIIQPAIIKYILRRYRENPGIRDGDVWFANDATYGGIHNPDMVVVMPVFYQGKLIAWVGAASHTTETGAIEPGGMPVSARSRFEEGLNLPPVKIGEEGRLREDWLEVFLAFGLRAPQMIVTDLRAKATVADRVRRRLLEVVEKEGEAFLIGVMRKALEVAEDGARQRIRLWPDGRYRCVTFGDRIGVEESLVRTYLTVIKEGDRIIMDFSGSSPETPSSYNVHVTGVVGHVANVLYSFVFYDLPISSATFAPIDFVIPEGTMLNPDPKAATSNAVMAATGVMSATSNTFARMLFPTADWRRVVASLGNAGNAMVLAGVNQWGLPFADMIAYSLNTEGMGGRAWKKGMDAFGFPWCPFGRAPDVELMENEFPLLVALSQHWPDSGGHGKHRGGVGTVQVWMAHMAPQVWFMAIADNSRIQTPQPLFGGYAPPTVPGLSVRGADLVQRMAQGDPGLTLDFQTLIQGNGQAIHGEWVIEPFARSVRPYAEGDVITFGFSCGGAGYGDPLEADPEGVVADVRDRKLTPWAARHIYRVAFDETTFKVDREATEKLRQEERQARLQRGRPYAEFIREWSTRRPPEEALAWYGSWPDAKPNRPVLRP